MTVPEELPFEVGEFQTFLVESRLLGKGESVSLTEHTPGFPRRQNLRRWHYDVRNQQNILCHLIVGLKLASVHDRAKEICTACPEITCRPLLFRERADGIGFLCLEHFSGDSIDSLVEQGRCDAAFWLNHVRHAQRILERTRQISTKEQLVDEVRSLIDEACSYPGFSEFDLQFLRGPAQRAIIAGAVSNPIYIQWSNGDFIGRNLLINPNGDVRLIDYEYAELTHFSCTDWLRLIEFSIVPSGVDLRSLPEMSIARQPWSEVRLWIHQLVQLKSALPSPTVTHHVMEAIGRLVGAVARTIPPDSVNEADSLLIKLISDRQLSGEALIEERTAWAQSLEAELQTAKQHFQKLSDEHTERSAWAKALESQLTTVKGHFEKLTQEFNERTTWAESLQAEHLRTQKHFEQLSREFDERTAWALAMDAELKTIRPSYQEQSETIKALSAERDRFKAELDAFREQKNKADADLAELKVKCADLGDWIPNAPSKGMVGVLDEALVTLAEFKRDLAVKNAETDRVAASQLEAKLTADTAALEVSRLTGALKDAQIHVEGLLRQSMDLRARNNFLEAASTDGEHRLRQHQEPTEAHPSL